MWIVTLLVVIAVAAALLYHGRAKLAWVVPIAILLGVWILRGGWGTRGFGVVAFLFVVAVFFLAVPAVRRSIVTPPLMRRMAAYLPTMSETEQVALDAGTVWWDGDLFSGAPDWNKWLGYPAARLTPEEQAFLDGPVEELCRVCDDWEMAKHGDLPPEAWEIIKRERLLSLIIPREYGGRDASAQLNSAMVAKLASRSAGLAITIMVPNSLGPAELIRHFGTDEQKQRYLPRLATCEEIPCFALTEPNAGSDAGGMQSYGVVCRGKWEGKEIIGIRLNWSKRYITLSTSATLLGLAFRLFDPEHLIGNKEDVGITCGLVPTSLPGIEHHRRHDPLGVPFQNGATTGENVFVPLDAIVGGVKGAGNGWKMLMYCLSAGRGISLPSLSTGTAKLATRSVGAYASVRDQFGVPLGEFEGIQESLARVAGLTYCVDAVRMTTTAAIDLGEKPPVISAIAKANSTEAMRKVVNDAMDVFAGAGVSLGPKNVLGEAYKQLPIGITVEGANILTRTMIIFGQGALRCHPFAKIEVRAIAEGDMAAFDRGFFGHAGFIISNLARTKLLSITDGRLVSAPVPGPVAPYFGRMSRMCAAFALAADAAMLTLGGTLKRREFLTGRFADAFSWLYIGSCALKRFVDDGQSKRDLPYVMWAMDHALFQIQEALSGVIDNLPNRWVARLLRLVIFTIGRRYSLPSDQLTAAVARGILEKGEAREHLTRGIFVPSRSEPGLGQLEDALDKVIAARPIQARIRDAVRGRKLGRRPQVTLIRRAEQAGIISAQEREIAEAAEKARAIAIAVDEFDSIEGALRASGADGRSAETQPAGRA